MSDNLLDLGDHTFGETLNRGSKTFGTTLAIGDHTFGEVLALGNQVTTLVDTPANAIEAIGSLAAYYKGENDVTDSSGNGYDGTDRGSVGYATGLIPRSPTAFDFTGASASSFFIADTNIAFDYMLTTATYSIAFWFEWDGFGSGALEVPFGNTVSGSIDGVSVFFDDRSSFKILRVFHNPAGTIQDTSANISVIPDADLHHFAFVANGDGALGNIYIDGSEVTYTTRDPLSAVGGATFGRDMNAGQSGSTTFTFDGRIDELAVFTKSLSAAEISDLYAEGP